VALSVALGAACGPATPSAAPSPTGAATAPTPAPPAPRDAAPGPAPTGAPPGPGHSLADAIEVCDPAGEVDYLSRLRCADGSAPAFARAGMAGFRSPPRDDADHERAVDQVTTARPLTAGERDLHPVDRFRVTCTGAADRTLYFDMYHCGTEPRSAPPPEGFSLDDSKHEERTTARP
jgi:hypothetical protein